jgi:hypothetical protein
MSSLTNDPITAIVVSAALVVALVIWFVISCVRVLARFYVLRSETRRMLRVLDHLDLAASTDVQITHLQFELQAIAGGLDNLRARLRGAAAGLLRGGGYDLARACKALALFAQMMHRSDAGKMAVYRGELCRALKLPLRAAERATPDPRFAVTQ